jgi:SNF2 family DNA or RNA helicase
MQSTQDRLRAYRSRQLDPSDIEYETIYPPFDNQRVTFEYLRTLDSCAILSEQGTGKTKCVIDYLDYSTDKQDRLLKVLVVAPNAVVPVWASEVKKHSRLYTDHVYPLRGARPRRQKIIEEHDRGIFVINFESIRAFWAAGDPLDEYDWDSVVSDEMTMIKSPSSKQSKAMHRFAKKPCKRIGLTGTPVAESPLDIFSQYAFLDPSIFGKSYFVFRNKYAELETRHFGSHSFKEIKSFRNIEELSDKVFSIGVRYTKDECLDLPDKLYTKRIIEWPTRLKKIYKEMCEEYLAEIADEEFVMATNAMAKATKLRQICNGWIYNDSHDALSLCGDATTPKHKEIQHLLENEIHGQVILWSEFRYDLTSTAEFLREKFPDKTTVLISGDTEMQDRDAVQDRFQSGEIDYLVMQLAIGRYGLTLTAAEAEIYISNSWRLETRLQSEARTHRIGQTKSILSIDLCMEDSIDLGISKSLEAKSQMSERITNEEMGRILNGG